jgi:hypothetical protein
LAAIRFPLIRNYDRTVCGWLKTASQETGLTVNQIITTCKALNLNWNTSMTKEQARIIVQER